MINCYFCRSPATLSHSGIGSFKIHDCTKCNARIGTPRYLSDEYSNPEQILWVNFELMIDEKRYVIVLDFESNYTEINIMVTDGDDVKTDGNRYYLTKGTLRFNHIMNLNPDNISKKLPTILVFS